MGGVQGLERSGRTSCAVGRAFSRSQWVRVRSSIDQNKEGLLCHAFLLPLCRLLRRCRCCAGRARQLQGAWHSTRGLKLLLVQSTWCFSCQPHKRARACQILWPTAGAPRKQEVSAARPHSAARQDPSFPNLQLLFGPRPLDIQVRSLAVTLHNKQILGPALVAHYRL